MNIKEMYLQSIIREPVNGCCKPTNFSYGSRATDLRFFGAPEFVCLSFDETSTSPHFDQLTNV
jgi:hypothetical protein